MRHSRVIRRSVEVALAVLSYGCADPVVPAPVPDPMPFDPSGSWEAQVQGLVSGFHFEAPMVVTLSVRSAPRAPTNDLADLTGTWQWGGLAGAVDGFWHPFRDATAEMNGCPLSNYCALGLYIGPPPGSCPELAEPFANTNTIAAWGWFEGSRRMVAALLWGTYWEGGGNQPCSGPVLMSLDTDATFSRN
jgi:hypothetical protein